MANETRKLRVRVNPYRETDAKGRPACAVIYPGSRGTAYVGAEIDLVETAKNGGKVVFKFPDLDTVRELPVDAYWTQAIRDGALVAEDAETAKFAGLPEDAKVGTAALTPKPTTAIDSEEHAR